MKNAELFDSLCGLVRAVAKVDPDVPMTPESDLVDDLGVDSLDLVSVVLQIQDDFGVDIAEDELPRMRTLGALVDYIADQRASQAA